VKTQCRCERIWNADYGYEIMVIQTDLLGLCGVNVGVNHRGHLLLERMRGPRTQWKGKAKTMECVCGVIC